MWPYSFPTTITITPRAPPYELQSYSNGIDDSSPVQKLDDIVSISHIANTFGKIKNRTYSSLAKIVRYTGVWKLYIFKSLEEISVFKQAAGRLKIYSGLHRIFSWEFEEINTKKVLSKKNIF